MIKEIAKKEITCLNMFPQPDGIAGNVSPLTIVTGKGLPDYNQMSIEFGAYAQVFEDNEPTNTNKARTVGAIALTATGNANGDYYFMSLATGARISRHNWTELPITNDAIARVEALAAAEGQPLIQEEGLVMEWRPGHVVDEDDYDHEYVPRNENDVDDDRDDEQLYELDEPIDEAELADLNEENWNPVDEGADDGDPMEMAEHAAQEGHYDDAYDDGVSFDDDPGPQLDEGAPEEGAMDEGAMNKGAVDEGAVDEGAPEEGAMGEGMPTEGPEAGGGRYGLRQRGANRAVFANAIDEPHSSKSYFPPHQFAQSHESDAHGHPQEHKSTERFIFAFIMTQMSAKAGIKKHGRAAEEALLAEFAQPPMCLHSL
jgi:hypothetical protein